MGTRKLRNKKAASVETASERNPVAAPLLGGVNLVIPTADLAPVMQRGVDVPPVGLPIMREGFVTETGFLPHTFSSQTRILAALNAVSA